MQVIAIASLTVSAAACARARAETVPDGPPLATPAPPPRVLAPVEEILVEAAPLPEPPVEAPAETSAGRRPAPRRPQVADTQKPPEPPPPAPPAAAPENPVRIPAQNPAEEKRIADILTNATRSLNNVNYQGLNENGKAQYNESKRFVDLAQLAIKDRNYPLAFELADKAKTIAEELLR